MLELFVDADACPVKEEVYRVAQRYGLQVTLVARTDKPDMTYSDLRNYLNLQGDPVLPVQSDHFRRQMLTANVKCRNLGLD